MIATLGGVLAASVVGSLHCAGMCGPLVSVAAAPVRVTSSGKEVMPGSAVGAAVLASVYNLGRLGTYLMLGAGAGAIGGVFDFGGRAVGVQRIAVMISGVMLLVMGIAMLLERAGVRVRNARAAGTIGAVGGTMRRVQAWAGKFGAMARAGMLGALSGLLPCGWLYAFVVTAGGTGHAVDGMLVMLAFWVGTVPVLTVLGAGLQTVLGPVRRHVPTVTAVVLVGAGVWSLAWRSSAVFAGNADVSRHESSSPPHCPLCDMKEKP